MMTRRNLLRLILFVAFALLALGVLPEAWRRWSVLLPSLSPLLSLGGALAARSAGLLALLGLPLLVLPLFKGRFFCWRLCPMGFAAEMVSRLNRRNTGLIRRLPFIGKGLALLIIGSAAIGWPLLIWTDPLCIFNGFFAAWRKPFTWLSAVTASGFVLILLVSLIAPNIWCHRLCPLGGLQEWITQLGNRLRAARKPITQETATALSRARAGRRVFLGFALGGQACSTATSACRPQQPLHHAKPPPASAAKAEDLVGVADGGSKHPANRAPAATIMTTATTMHASVAPSTISPSVLRARPPPASTHAARAVVTA